MLRWAASARATATMNELLVASEVPAKLSV